MLNRSIILFLTACGVVVSGAGCVSGPIGSCDSDVESITSDLDPVVEESEHRVAAPDILSVDGVNSESKDQALQTLTGLYRVHPDGTVNLKRYGAVYVAGQTLDEVRQTLEKHLSQFVVKPELRMCLEVIRSRYALIILDGGGFGEAVIRHVVRDNETIHEAVASVTGVPQSQTRQIQVARPSVAGEKFTSWTAVADNEPLLPGDRVHVRSDGMFGYSPAYIPSPFERMLGFFSLGHSKSSRLQLWHVSNAPPGGF